MNANKTNGVKAWRQLHKNAASNIEQVMEAAPHKAAAVRSPITKTIQGRRTRYAGHCRRSRDEIISDILQWTSSHGLAKTGRPARTYIQQLCAEAGCNLEDLLEAMDDREGWRERVRDIRADGATWWWWWSSSSYLPNPSARAGYDTRSIFKLSLTGLNLEFSFS